MSKPQQKITTMAPADQSGGKEEPVSQAQIDYDEGRGYVERGETALAAVALHNALRGFEEEGNREGVANASNQLGHACLQRKEYDKALTHYQQAWEICEEFQDEMSLLTLSRQLVQVYRGLKQYRKGLDICLELLDTYRKNNDPRGTVSVLELMAELYLDTGERDKAADAYRTVASIHANFKHESIAESYRQKAADLSGGAA